MAAYVLGEIEVTDPVLYEEYRREVPALIAKHGGRYLVRGGRVEPLDGGRSPKRFVALMRLRQKAARGKLVLVEGV